MPPLPLPAKRHALWLLALGPMGVCFGMAFVLGLLGHALYMVGGYLGAAGDHLRGRIEGPFRRVD